MTVAPADVSYMLVNSERSSVRYQKHANASTNKHRKHSTKERITMASSDADVEEAESSNDAEEESRVQEKQLSTGVTPAFVGHCVVASCTHSALRSTVSSIT